jgi:6-phosphogluconate dehydrogenase (decarboxylating)
VRRSDSLKKQGIHYLDAGTSGGVWGIERGYCLMIGGDEGAVKRLEPIFEALDYYVRQFRDMKGAVTGGGMDGSALMDYGRICGALLAKGHEQFGRSPTGVPERT